MKYNIEKIKYIIKKIYNKITEYFFLKSKKNEKNEKININKINNVNKFNVYSYELRLSNEKFDIKEMTLLREEELAIIDKEAYMIFDMYRKKRLYYYLLRYVNTCIKHMHVIDIRGFYTTINNGFSVDNEFSINNRSAKEIMKDSKIYLEFDKVFNLKDFESLCMRRYFLTAQSMIRYLNNIMEARKIVEASMNKLAEYRKINEINKINNINIENKNINKIDKKNILNFEFRKEYLDRFKNENITKFNKNKIDEKYINNLKEKNLEVNIIKKEKDLTKLYKDNPNLDIKRSIAFINPCRDPLMTAKRMLKIQNTHKNSIEELKKIEEEQEKEENNKKEMQERKEEGLKESNNKFEFELKNNKNNKGNKNNESNKSNEIDKINKDI